MIFYFSGTGNTKWAAKIIAKATNDQLIDICNVDWNKSYVLGKDERLGFAFPIHGWRPPVIVRNFVHKLNIDNALNHFSYAICTAGDNIGEALRIFSGDLEIKGITLDGMCSLIMPESYVGLPFMDVDTPDNERQKKEKAKNELDKFIDIIVDKKNDNGNLIIGHWPRINSRLLGALFTKYLITDKPFHVDKDKCLRCGKCAYCCPVSNITYDRECLPQWSKNSSCLVCFSCYHHCPVHAIEYGKRTLHKGQYYYGRNNI